MHCSLVLCYSHLVFNVFVAVVLMDVFLEFIGVVMC